jgi:hypothetical protein
MRPVNLHAGILWKFFEGIFQIVKKHNLDVGGNDTNIMEL